MINGRGLTVDTEYKGDSHPDKENSTPRTDANVVRGFDALRITKDEEQWVKADFARQLERELVEEKAKSARLLMAGVRGVLRTVDL